MSRPQIIVNVSAALARRGDPSATGTAFMAFTAPAGIVEPLRCRSAADATDASVPTPVANWVGDCLAEGAPEVILVRATAAAPEAVTQGEWAAALDQLTSGYGAGQVLIPGVSDATAHAALLAHSVATGRTVLLDGAEDDGAAELAAAAAAVAASAGAERAGLIAPWVSVAGAAGVLRSVPGSVVAAGLAARGDSRVGHTNHAPAGTHSGGAGVVRRGLAVVSSFTNAELDTLHDAGVSVIKMVAEKPTLYGWRSVSDDERFAQLNAGRMAMQLGNGVASVAEPFLFRQIDGRGHLYSELEGALRGYLVPLWTANALFGDTEDEAFEVDVRGVNNNATAAAGQLHAAVEVRLTPHTEKVVIDVVTSIAEGA